MNLKKALRRGKIKEFAKQHDSKGARPHGQERFQALC